MFGSKVVSFDDAKVAKMPGVKKVMKVKDTAVAVVADTWWHAKTALDALPITWDEGDNAKVSNATHREASRRRTERRREQRRAQERRRARRDRGCGEEDRGDLFDPVPLACLHGDDERDREAFGRQGRGLGADAEVSKPRWRRCRKNPACRSRNAKCTATISAAASAGAADCRTITRQAIVDREGVPRHAGQADLEPRGRPGARFLSPDLDVQDVGRPRREGRAGRPACEVVRPVDQCLAQSGRHRRRQGPPPAAGLVRGARATRSSATPCRTC